MPKFTTDESDLSHVNERYLTTCIKCNHVGLKRNKAALLLRESSYDTMKTIGYVCRGCLPNLLEDLEVSL